MKDEKVEWSNEEMLETFANTPHERHSIMTGFVNGLSEGSKFEIEDKYKDEEHYYALGWSVGEIIDRISNPEPEDTKQALAQITGIILKYIIIGAASVGIFNII